MEAAIEETVQNNNASIEPVRKPKRHYMSRKSRIQTPVTIDTDADETFDALGVDFDNYNISSVPNDFNVKTIFTMLEEKKLKIPPFQRNYVWDIRRASKFCESLLLDLPVPQIFFYETENKELLVIDGQQRLMSMYYFMKESFPIKERRAELKTHWNSGHIPEEILKDESYFADFKLRLPDIAPGKRNKFKNLKYSQLNDVDRNSFNLRTIRCVMIRQNKQNSDDSCVFEIFHRLNSGGINLHPQEIRMSLYYSSFFEILTDLNVNPEWRRLLGSEHPDFHTKDIETMLRGFAFLEEGEKYSPSLIKFLNNYSKKSQNNTNDKNNYLQNLFLSFLQATQKLPDDIFIRNDKFNLALFEAVFIATCLEPYQNQRIVTTKLDAEKINELASDPEFIEATQKNTTSSANVRKRLARAQSFLTS